MITATEMRREARKHLTGKWGKGALITLCFVLVQIVINLILNLVSRISILYLLVAIADLLISIPLSYGLIVSFMKLKRDEEVKAFNFLTIGFNNFSRAWKVTLRMVLKLIVPIILTMVCTFGIVFCNSLIITSSAVDSINNAALSAREKNIYATQTETALLEKQRAQMSLEAAKQTYKNNNSETNKKAVEQAQKEYDKAEENYNKVLQNKPATTSTQKTTTSTSTNIFAILILVLCIALFAISIYYVVKQLLYVLSYQIAYDEPNLTAKEVVEKSKTLMKGHRGNYFVLSLSFIGWAILAALTFGIGCFWLFPYMTVATICFYECLAGKAKGDVEVTAESAVETSNPE